MRIIELNAVPYGATGRIAKQIAEVANECGHEAVFAYSWTKDRRYNSQKNEWVIIPFFSRLTHLVTSKLVGLDGFHSKIATKMFLRKMDEFKPDIIHLHIMHSYFLNLPLLFEYIKNHDISVFWTFQDCWALTGQCPHFVLAKCDKWERGCNHCPLQKEYSLLPVDSARKEWNLKKHCISGIKDMTIVPTSEWVADFTKRSMFADYPIHVINNGIDLDIFKPTYGSFRKRYKCENKKIVLGVAFVWFYRKGLDVFISLAKLLPEDYVLVMVGTDLNVDKELPENIISIHRTKDQRELAEIYTAADVFINPTREDTYPTVNMECLACGTPVITFNTGGSPESVDDTCGSVVECDDIESMYKEIIRVCTDRPYSRDACLNRAKGFNLKNKYLEYIRLFESSRGVK